MLWTIPNPRGTGANSAGRFSFGGRLVTSCAVLVLLAGSLLAQGLDVQSRPEVQLLIRSHFLAAQQAQRQSNYAAAEREYKAALAMEPAFAEAHMNLGLIYQLQFRLPEAMAEFHHALKIKRELAGANFFLGVDYCKMGDAAKALPHLEAAVREEPTRPDTWSWLATAMEMSGQIQAEVVTINRALKIQPDNVDLLYLLGHAYEKLGKEQVARLEKEAPGSSLSEQLLGQSYAESTDWPSAVIHYQNAIYAAPVRPGLHVELGEVFLQAGKIERASHEFADELHIDSHSLRAVVRRGEVELLQGDIGAALQDWSTAIAIDEPQAERVLGLGKTGLDDSVVAQLSAESRSQVEQLAPSVQELKSPAAHFALAFLATLTGNGSVAAEEAALAASSDAGSAYPDPCSETELRQAIARGRVSGLSPCALRVLTGQSSPEFRFLAAAAMLEAGNYDDSLDALKGLPPSREYGSVISYWRARCYEKLAAAAYMRLYQTDRNSYRVHQLRADLDVANGEDVAAIAEYRAAIAQKPSVPNLHYSLGHLLWKNSKVDEARSEFEAELALNPRHAGALNDLGQTYLLEHQPEKALPYLKRALAGGVEDADIHRDLGTAYTELADYKKAEAEFQLALPSDYDGSLHFKLARVYKALGEKDKATREFALAAALKNQSHAKLEKQAERLAEIEK